MTSSAHTRAPGMAAPLVVSTRPETTVALPTSRELCPRAAGATDEGSTRGASVLGRDQSAALNASARASTSSSHFFEPRGPCGSPPDVDAPPRKRGASFAAIDGGCGAGRRVGSLAARERRCIARTRVFPSTPQGPRCVNVRGLLWPEDVTRLIPPGTMGAETAKRRQSTRDFSFSKGPQVFRALKSASATARVESGRKLRR